MVDAEGVGVLPWVVGPDGPGPGRLVGNLVLGAAIPVLNFAGVLRGEPPAALAVAVMALAVPVGAGLVFRSRWPLALLAVPWIVVLLGAAAVLLRRRDA